MNHICPHCNLELTKKDLGINSFNQEVNPKCPYCKTELEYAFSKKKHLQKYIYSIIASLIVLIIKITTKIQYGVWEALFYIPLLIVVIYSIYKYVKLSTDKSCQDVLIEKDSK